ncbi:hypothetical protein ASPWEDRAFT_176490 [Aspergillus wentii DTO 134E9]|uniref:Uncharacterized protein n=1 Tax=Aspergillus wentii DTO 134E9 TaxID=1073089 RepID=A0A1L9R912_ASPWE|nr:uncharacterized protein ASPWEDRAFT_176490 [Aspergillus wentii DTO 134E9]KAI9926538.1 hypothetical protein MW887_004306 [Aspergillus wentii]OJJ31415.1 hypothetical protein ASPWEDRAFT_176490 [Aspergillus wentii DTO 134E9]
MAPSEYGIRLQKGITGGFAPPTPTAIYQLYKESEGSSIKVSKSEREDGTPSLGAALEKSLDASDEALDLVDELYNILKELPIEQPAGSEDIYGHDTSIAWFDNDFQWLNGSHSGVQGGSSYVQASADQKKLFERAIEIVQSLVDMAE